MDNDYILAALTHERLSEMHAAARVAALLAAAPPRRRAVRAAVGRLLVTLGNRLLAGVTPVRAAA